MKDWLNKKKEKISSDSKRLFNEADLCYSIKANRASMLFSYLGLFTIIKERIVASKKPDTINQSRWDNILNELNDEDKWEKRVFDELVNSSAPIFNINDSIRQQIKYWKDRRNDCAHFKENEINNYHVQIFWSFIKSNLSKITIEGGKLNLLKKIEIHFDETKTPPDADYKYLLKEIETAIEISESKSFFEDFHNILNEALYHNDKKISDIFYDSFNNIESENLKDKFREYIKSKNNLDLRLIKHNPQFINLLNYSPEEIRQMWKTRVNNSAIYKDTKYYIYSTLLSNGLIPISQKKEAMSLFYTNFNQQGFANLPSNEIIRQVLACQELLDIIYQELFENGEISSMDYLKINSKADLIELFIEFNRTNESKVFKELTTVYKSENPWWLTGNLKSLFNKKPEILDRYKEICASESIDFPEELE